MYPVFLLYTKRYILQEIFLIFYLQNNINVLFYYYKIKLIERRNGMKVYEIRIRVYILENIPYQKMLSQEAHFIDSALARDKNWLEYHKERQYKNYSFGGLYPVEKDGLYKRDKIYTITMRTMDAELAKYLTRVLRNHYTRAMKGLTMETRIIPKKIISELYTLTPVLQKTEDAFRF